MSSSFAADPATASYPIQLLQFQIAREQEGHESIVRTGFAAKEIKAMHLETPVYMQTTNKTNVQQAVPFFRVSNMEKSICYYVDGLGFEMTKKWIPRGRIEWCWLQLGGAALMLQEFRKEGHDSPVPSGKVGEGVSICFQCQDALQIYREVKSRGIDAKRPFVGNAMWVTTLSDPDGYRIEFESPTDVPEETELSE